jgi:hypothetical protein
VGDERARNFKAKSAPFALDDNYHSIWNSVSVIDTGVVVAIGTIGEPNRGGGRVMMIKGYPLRQAGAAFGTITVDGVYSSTEKWTTSNRSQLYMGQVTKNRTSVDFLYDNEYLYLTARVVDRTIINPDNGLDNDGVRFFIDADDVSGSTPQAGMYGFFFDTNGKIQFQRAANGAWTTDNNTSEIRYAVNVQSAYYLIEAAIPWRLIGHAAPPVESRMAIAVEIVNKEQYRLTTEKIPDVVNSASWTWLEFRLLPNGDTGIASAGGDDPDVKTFVKANTLYVQSPFDIKALSLYSLEGQLIERRLSAGSNVRIPLPVRGGGVLEVSFADGRALMRKIVF